MLGYYYEMAIAKYINPATYNNSLMKNEIVEWLQNWAKTQADGDWEHEMGLSLSILDNPGWDFNVDMVNYENLLCDIPYTLAENSPSDWFGYKINNSYLNIAGDLDKLSYILSWFKELVRLLEEEKRKVASCDLKEITKAVFTTPRFNL